MEHMELQSFMMASWGSWMILPGVQEVSELQRGKVHHSVFMIYIYMIFMCICLDMFGHKDRLTE